MPKKHKIHKTHPVGLLTREDVVIRWRKPGSFISKRLAHKRQPGAEDICSPLQAERLSTAGLVDILGPISSVLVDRTISFESVAEILGEDL